MKNIFFSLFFVFALSVPLNAATYTSPIGPIDSCQNDSNCTNGQICIDVDSLVSRKVMTDEKSKDSGYTDTETSFCLMPSSGQELCVLDSDCISLGKNKCLNSVSSYREFVPKAGVLGICGASADTTEQNVFVFILCKVINLLTGAAGRGFAVIVLITTSIMFFTGKVSWNLLLAVVLGIGILLGAPSLIKVFAGKGVMC